MMATVMAAGLVSSASVTPSTMATIFVLSASAPMLEWSQSRLKKDGSYHLLKEMPSIALKAIPAPREGSRSLTIDRSARYQSILGFGGAFTEAAALNWRSLTQSDQEAVIKRYFASPSEGGLGYTVGRVPINSCDFGPGDALRTYSFDNVTGDVEHHAIEPGGQLGFGSKWGHGSCSLEHGILNNVQARGFVESGHRSVFVAKLAQQYRQTDQGK